MDSSQKPSSSQPVQATTAGKPISAAQSGKSSRRQRTRLTLAQERDLIQLYLENNDYFEDIAKAFNIHFSTMYAILKRHNIPPHTAAGRRPFRKADQQVGYETATPHFTPQLEYTPPIPEPVPAVQAEPALPPDVPAPRPRRRAPRKPKTFWQRLKALFGR